MKLKDIKNILEAKVIVEANFGTMEIKTIVGSDLMSDVLAFSKSGSLLLTGLTNSQVVRTAEITEIKAICFICGKKPQDEAIELARENQAPLFTTNFSMYEACGRLYENGLPGHE